MNVGGQERKLGKIIELYGEKAIIQVFEGTENMALRNTHTRLTGHPMERCLREMLGRTFNGIGPAYRLVWSCTPENVRLANGKPLNPVSREYPRNYILDRYFCHRRTGLL